MTVFTTYLETLKKSELNDFPDTALPLLAQSNFRDGSESLLLSMSRNRLLLCEQKVSFIFNVLGAVPTFKSEPHGLAGFEACLDDLGHIYLLQDGL